MLDLKLREEFRGKLLEGTAIELPNDSKTGATQVGAKSFLEITYPTHDLVKAIRAIGPGQARPVVIMGERGAGKSHLMAALYHAVNDPSTTRLWLGYWADKVKSPEIATLPLRSGMAVIGDSLHRQRYKFLWDGPIDDDTQRGHLPPPVNAEPMTRQFLRIFSATASVERDQMQKLLRGSGVTPDDFEQRGWCTEKAKVFTLVPPLAFAEAWYGKHRRRLTADLDQALVLLGACQDGSGINAADTLKNENFRPHPALKAVLEWFAERGADATTRQAARRALTLYAQWAEANKAQVEQMQLFLDEAPA